MSRLSLFCLSSSLYISTHKKWADFIVNYIACLPTKNEQAILSII